MCGRSSARSWATGVPKSHCRSERASLAHLVSLSCSLSDLAVHAGRTASARGSHSVASLPKHMRERARRRHAQSGAAGIVVPSGRSLRFRIRGALSDMFTLFAIAGYVGHRSSPRFKLRRNSLVCYVSRAWPRQGITPCRSTHPACPDEVPGHILCGSGARGPRTTFAMYISPRFAQSAWLWMCPMGTRASEVALVSVPMLPE